jgi:predicted Zn finger-like uncharacterized protein
MKTQCPHCQTKFKTSDGVTGKKINCPKCNQPFVISPLIKDNKVEVCSTCGKEIGKLQQACVFSEKIVCAECDKKLRGTQVATTQTSSQTERRESELAKEKTHATRRQRPHIHERKTQNPLGIFGTTIGALIFFIVIIPLMRVTCDEITSRARIKKAQEKTTTSIVNQPNERRRTVPVDQSTQEREKTTVGLPTDGVYSTDAGSGGSYKDPINGFFVVQAPSGFEIKERLDKTKFVIHEGSSHVGETVPASFIQFIYANKTFIAVTARKTFTTIEHDFDAVLDGLPTKFSGIKIHRHRFVTIDGVKGGEVFASLRGQKLLMVKYKKYGLDHTITINCDDTDFPKFEDKFVAFLCSYRSLKSEQDVKQADGERPVVSFRQDDKKQSIELKKTESPQIRQTGIFAPIGFAVAESVPTYLLLTSSQRYALQKPTDPYERFFIVVICAQSDLFIPSEIQYQALKKEEEAMKKSIVSRERIRIYDPKRFQLILSNGQKLQGEMISDWASDSFGSTSSGFGLDIRMEFTKAAPPSDEIETIAVAWTLGINSCNLPVKVSIDDMVPITVPDQKFNAPRGR